MGTTIIAMLEYYHQIRKAHKAYEKARDFVEDIVLSFNRDLRRETEKLDSMVAKVEAAQTTASGSTRKAENLENMITKIERQVDALSKNQQTLSQTFTKNILEISQNNTSRQSWLTGLETKIGDIEANQETFRSKIASFEEQLQKIANSSALQEIKTEVVVPPIPIRRDRALAALTETEILVLEMLSKEGPKTAPETKEKVQLSREHTARLMKKLYEEGYLEREAGKIPFRYNIKKEMELLLHKVGNPTA
jgi:archaellum component FlaC